MYFAVAIAWLSLSNCDHLVSSRVRITWGAGALVI